MDVLEPQLHFYKT